MATRGAKPKRDGARRRAGRRVRPDGLHERLQGKRRKKRHPFRKLLLIGIVASVLAIALNEDLRKAVLDRLFGAEEEFEYTSQTTAAPAPAATE